MNVCLINGHFETHIYAGDRGLHYGDGLFETLRIEHGQLRYLELHLARLFQSCERLALPAPSEALLRHEIKYFLGKFLCQDHKSAVLKIIITRGVGERGYASPQPMQPSRILLLYPFQAAPAHYYEQGIRAHLCELRLAHQRRLAGIKHLNRLENVLARQEWDDPDIPEGLLFDQMNHLISGVKSNVFIVKKGLLITPDLHQCGIEGVTRRLILESEFVQQEGCMIRAISRAELFEADEVFVCNSLIGLWPIRQIGDVCFKVGPVAKRLMEYLYIYH